MKYIIFILAFMMAGCSSVMVKEGTLDKTQGKVWVQPGGYQMRHAIKHSLEERNFDLVVGKLSTAKSLKDIAEIDTYTSDARYAVRIEEGGRWLNPVCLFNGFWYWSFNASISDNQTGKELLSWNARGCQGYVLRRLEDYLDKLEGKK
ncbi:MAG: hypothetical protein LBB23_04315 [Rickettsiales bacterium]|jgi:hypothetical protein|nr:hypothetical protein [Rickettsiales bacterium]